MAELAPPTKRKIFNLVGESYKTRRGLERQTVLLAAEPGDPLILIREPDNEFDPNAVLAVLGEHDIGFLSKEDAAVISPALDAGVLHTAQIHELTGGVGQARNYGARISIAWLSQKLPSPKMRDERQELAREQKAIALEKSRDSQGRFKKDSNTGCGIVFLLLLVSVISFRGAQYFI